MSRPLIIAWQLQQPQCVRIDFSSTANEQILENRDSPACPGAIPRRRASILKPAENNSRLRCLGGVRSVTIKLLPHAASPTNMQDGLLLVALSSSAAKNISHSTPDDRFI
jgi:hypothetical protein